MSNRQRNAGSGGKCKPPQPSTASSRRTQGAGSFDIDLTPFTPAGIECRTPGASGTYQMVVTFSKAVTVNAASVLSGTGAVSSFSVSGVFVTVNLTGVTNMQTLVVNLIDVSDGTLSGNVPVAMSVLVGDTNGDGAVNSGDAIQTRGRAGATVDGTNFHSDVNADGSINSGDAIAVRSRSGTSLP